MTKKRAIAPTERYLRRIEKLEKEVQWNRVVGVKYFMECNKGVPAKQSFDYFDYEVKRDMDREAKRLLADRRNESKTNMEKDK